MDLINTGEEQQQPRTTIAGPFVVGEKPGTAASSDAMSRPSLISSLWSIQVQNEGSASDFPMMEGCGSQQSLPEMVVAGGGTCSTYQNCNGYSGNLCGCETSNAEQINADLASRAIIPMEMQNRTSGGQQSLRPAKSLSGE
uniref:EB domain-containing protein n=1 Tax=Meloidogyne hapla TaxID=6305 RepID=A0A1I8BMK3_MELHA